jgi:YbbR domain-containing protein
MKNLGLRLVAILLACVVWFIVSAPRREPVRERLVTAPLSVVAMPNDLVITTEIPGQVAIRVRGRSSDLRALATMALDVPVDLAWVQTAGEIAITLRPQAINVPPEIEVVSIEPNKFRFRIEKLLQSAVRIRPFLVGDVPSGYNVGEPTANPELVLVAGPASQVLKMTEVATERIIMTGRTATFVQEVAVVSDSPLVRIISPLTTQITVPVLAEIGPNPLPATTGTAATDTSGTATPMTTATTATTGTERDNP